MRLAGGTAGAVVKNLRLGKTNPRHQPPKKTMRFAQARQLGQRPAADQPEITGIVRDGRAAEFLDQEIKETRRKAFRDGFSPAFAAGGINHVVATPAGLDHFHNHRRRVLQIGIHGDHHVAPRRFEAGGEGELVAEVA